MSVVARASTRRPRRRERAGAAISPTKADVPAPVRTMRRSERSSSGARKASSSSRRTATMAAASPQTSGCWAISRTVASEPGAGARTPVVIFGLDIEFSLGGCSGRTLGKSREARRRIGAQRVADLVHHERARFGGQDAGSNTGVLVRQELADQGERDLQVRQVLVQAVLRSLNLVVRPVVAQPIAVAETPRDALFVGAALVVTLPVARAGQHPSFDDVDQVGALLSRHQFVFNLGQREKLSLIHISEPTR